MKKVVRTPNKVTKSKKGAKYIKHSFDPIVVRIVWGETAYDYYLAENKELNVFLWMKNEISENKACVWLKKKSRRCEKVK